MDQSWLEDARQDSIERLVNETISHTRFSNMADLRILDKERAIRAMVVRTAHELAMEAKDVPFQMTAEFLYVSSLRLSFTELKPGLEKPLG